MAVARMNGRDADLGWLAPGHIATISHLILRKRQNEVPEKRKLNDDSRRGDTKIGQSPSPREQAAQIQELGVRLDSNNLQLVVNTYSEKMGHSNCVILRESCKASMLG